ncbi:unnamed protein product [Triticum turgidum subsp. durum]|uniref:Protein TONSOKU n=1 Tax=Triticum turgidum subsp. durum TaxID=4567 RepID=A0A9R0YUX9_TRITD|nr:unnamed protein product [Triticum turgidum subsp. durum]
MKLVKGLRENAPSGKSPYLKELIDSYNNLGMLELDLDNLEEAEQLLNQGLKICDEEEVNQYDDARTRLHHNLGNVYTELRNWNKAKVHIEKDIAICRNIDHIQGEAKGFINLGELHSRIQKYGDAKLCYEKALQITKGLEDEDALVDQIHQNIETVTKAAEVLEELKKDEQKLKKLVRDTSDARGTSNERKLLCEQHAWLDNLIEKARMISAWPKHKEFSKGKKRVTNELREKEKQSDALLSIGESYQKLRIFGKARKWYMKSWNMYRSIGNLEGQALAKVNIGNVLDSCGDWADSDTCISMIFRIAVEGNLPNVQLSALENMHYSHMVRFDSVEDAKKVHEKIDNLKQKLNQHGARDTVSDYCSETESEGGDASDKMLDQEDSGEHAANTYSEEPDDHVVLASLVHRSRSSSNTKASKIHSIQKKVDRSCDIDERTREVLSKSCSNQSGKRRVRVFISDDEADQSPEIDQSKKKRTNRTDSLSTSEDIANGANNRNQVDPTEPRDVYSICTPCPAEESICSFKSSSPTGHGNDGLEIGASSGRKVSSSKPAASGSRICTPASHSQPHGQNAVGLLSTDADHQHLAFRIGQHLVYLDLNACICEAAFNIESLKVEVACVYHLQIPDEKSSKGLLPIIGELKCCGNVLDGAESIDYIGQLASEQKCIEAFVDGMGSAYSTLFIELLLLHESYVSRTYEHHFDFGILFVGDWVPKRLMKLYVDFCTKSSEAPNKKLLKKLYNLEVSEDEIILSDCGLQDLSISPLLEALRSHKTIAMLDLSHNMLGNETIESLQQIFASSSQTYGGLTLDLHCNRFGPTALFQICECAVMTERLEVLNLAGNRLTDGCSSYLFTILQKCKALYSLDVEQCSITSRTVQKMADALHEGSVLSHLSIGKNNPISGNTMLNLLSKLASLKRFSQLSLTGIKLNKLIVDKLCLLAQSLSLSGYLLGGTSIGPGGTIRLTEALSSASQELMRLDLSNCGLTTPEFSQICTNLSRINILDLNLGGNSINMEGCDAVGAVLANPQCSLRSLTLDRCNLGLGNDQLEELSMAENANLALERTLHLDEDMQDVSTGTEHRHGHNAEAGDNVAPGNVDLEKMVVADSEDEAANEDRRTVSGPARSCASSCQRNSYSGCQFVQELAEALVSAKQLRVLDLSQNGLSEEAVQSLYSAWASGPRGDGVARKHVGKEVVHFSVDGATCCGLKPCCRRDLQM